MRLSGRPLGTVVDDLVVSGTVEDCLGDLLAPSLTVLECLATSKTVWQTSWHRRRRSGCVWHRLGVSGTVLDRLGDLLALS
ncbi:hypothetical protein DPMN_090638 [Dreissena polymorpha]|uniref:Uncharacterized protein n=1 Tax=Dreissena polymorpha TaxID=45954 RepID=A0A9D4QYH8_DREPO|nr:hypothetical protein DPMN_090634 [Dreissena polymorpha]KAH3848279.1 hypothetical protein DPMN_090638 [Dreissena polymorpha]